MSGDFEIEDWLSSNDFCEDTIEKLHRAKVRDLDSLCLLSQYDVTALKLEIGDRGKFRRAIKRVCEQYPDEDQEHIDSRNTGVDDLFDVQDPDQVATQQCIQLDELRKLQADQEKLRHQQSHLGDQGVPARTPVDPTVKVNAVVWR